MNSEDQTPISLAELQTAISANQFSLYYQPKVDCEHLNLRGFEALIRWEHPTRGLVMPDKFIPLAEESGLIGKITEIVVDTAFQWYKSTAGVPGLTISINLSAVRLSDLDFADWLQRRCRSAGVRLEAVMLEVSETSVMKRRLEAFDLFTRLREKGLRVSIDDFGPGQSSLTLLARLPFSEIKIEKSFVMNATTNEEARAFIKSTVALAHTLKLTVVAEGVEDRETLTFLQGVGCDFAHGYLICRPMPGAEAIDWILNRRQRTRHIMLPS